jgi:hypothetical protein
MAGMGLARLGIPKLGMGRQGLGMGWQALGMGWETLVADISLAQGNQLWRAAGESRLPVP